MRDNWIKLHRKILDNPVVTKDADHLAIWIWLLCEASYTEHERMFGGKKITMKPGQLITGREQIAKELKVNQNKVQRVLKRFETEQQIEQQTTRYGRLISILNWSEYQSSEQQTEQQVNNKRTTSEQQVNATEERNKGKKKKKEIKEKDSYGEFGNVKLTKEELQKLQEKFRDWKERIEALSAYMKSNGKTYKDHYATILNWSRREGNKPRTNQYIQEPPRYKEFEKEPEKQREPMPESTKKIMEQLGGMFK